MSSLGIKNLPTYSYHTQTNDQTERYITTLISSLNHGVVEHQRICEAFFQPLTYVDSTQARRSTKCTAGELVTRSQHNGPILFPIRRTSEYPLPAEQLKISLLTHLRGLVEKT